MERLYTEEQKQKRVLKEIERLRKIYKDLPKETKDAAEGLIQEAAFMCATLEETRAIINKEGVLELFEQGAQKLIREHPATKVYASIVQRYAMVSKQLVDLLPTGSPKEKEKDTLMAFVKDGKR